MGNKIQLHQDECHAEELKFPGGSALSLDLVGLTTRMKQLSAEGRTTSFAPVHVVIRRIRRHVEHLLAECSTIGGQENPSRVNRSDGPFLRGLTQTQMYQKYRDDGLGSALVDRLSQNPVVAPSDCGCQAVVLEDMQLKAAQKTTTDSIAQATKILFRTALTGSPKEFLPPNSTTISDDSATLKGDTQVEELIFPSRSEEDVERDSPSNENAVDIAQDTASKVEDFTLVKIIPAEEKLLKASTTEAWTDSFSVSELNVLALLSSRTELEPVVAASTKCSDSKTTSSSSLVSRNWWADESAAKSNDNLSRTDAQQIENTAIGVSTPSTGFRPTHEQVTLENTACMDLAWLSECLEADQFDDCESFDSDEINLYGDDALIAGSANHERSMGELQQTRNLQETKELSIRKIQLLWRHWRIRKEAGIHAVETHESHVSELEITNGRQLTQESPHIPDLVGVCILVHVVSPNMPAIEIK